MKKTIKHVHLFISIAALGTIGSIGAYAKNNANPTPEPLTAVEQSAAEDTNSKNIPNSNMSGNEDPQANEGDSTEDSQENSTENDTLAETAASTNETASQSAANDTTANQAQAAAQHNPVTVTGATHGWSTNVLANKSIFKGPHNPAAQTANEWQATRPNDAAAMRKVAAPAKGIWLVRGISSIQSYVGNISASAAAQGSLPLYVLYGMPTVNCNGPSDHSATSYLQWVREIKNAASGKAVFVIEPDEIPLEQCGGAAESSREQVLADAVAILASAGHYLYIDAGHGHWVDTETIAQRLERVGVRNTQGFSLNVSNYETTSVNRDYGERLSRRLGGAHYIIDTSRNGIGPDSNHEWCNAPGRRLGELPTTLGSSSKLNALLWVKYPGESDGTCNGGPSEGAWWPEYALQLAQ